MLRVHDINQEFELKSKCEKRKSIDFETERASF